ncbi:P-loop containing nucleoside triphosphate hydrolase protein [Geranomyces variabilis]|nr:P-loop containing nucleoside triphosphate hydrolase protein [Geranomyces variabilis]KAJ3133716.1 ATP-binding cassette sub- C member 8 [Geranomyces variabilis]
MGAAAYPADEKSQQHHVDANQIPVVSTSRNPTIEDDFELGHLLKQKQHRQPQQSSVRLSSNSFLGRTFLNWLTPVLRHGYRQPLQTADLAQLTDKEQAHNVAYLLEVFWDPLSNGTMTLRQALWMTFKSQLVLAGAAYAVGVAGMIAIPIVLQHFILFLQENPTDVKSKADGYIYSCAMFALLLVSNFARRYHDQTVKVIGLNVRTLLLAGMYKKSLKLSPAARLAHPAGHVISMIGQDIEVQNELLPYLHQIWATPVQIIVVFALVGHLIGLAALPGFGIMMVLFAFSVLLDNMSGPAIGGLFVAKDSRLKRIREALQAIKVLKLHAWESFFAKSIHKARNEELAHLRKILLLRGSFATVGQLIVLGTSVTSFVVYYALGHTLSTDVIFAVLAYFNSLFVPIWYFSQILNMARMANASLARMGSFFAAEELNISSRFRTFNPAHQHSIVVKDATFEWPTAPVEGEAEEGAAAAAPASAAGASTDTDENPKNESSKSFSIDHLTLSIKTGTLVAIVGNVGSGKSSLLSALVGEMTKTSGDLHFNGNLAFSPQTPWVLSATVRENILFGKAYDKQLYDTCLRVCGLEQDLAMFANRDLTEIGEKGATLSGGQRARISLARAVYSASGKGSILLMDDVLSALDAHVGAHVFNECIKRHLAGTTRVFVTHQLQYLSACDHILVMDKGNVVEAGSYETLRANPTGALSTMMAGFSTQMKEEVSEDMSETADLSIATPNSSSSSLVSGDETEVGTTGDAEGSSEDAGGLIVEEERETGAVKLVTYLTYLRAASLPAAVLVLIVVLVARAFLDGGNIILAYWSTDHYGWADSQYLKLYVVLNAAQIVATLFGTFGIVLISLAASTHFHSAALEGILSAPLHFFETNPTGRILNRFSNDIMGLDLTIWNAWFAFVAAGIIPVAGTIVVIGIVVPYLLLLIAPIAIGYLFLQRFYRSSTREIKRLESMERSPMMAQFSETLTGLSIIHAYRASSRFAAINEQLLDRSNTPSFNRFSADTWLQGRAECVSAILTLGLSLFGAGGIVDTGLVALALTYAIQVTENLNVAVIGLALLEVELNGVERLSHYIDGVQKESTAGATPPRSQWPTRGAIKMENLVLQYPSRSTPALKNISLEIRPAEKIGICGRTGCGKSTLISALFRTVEARSGSISVDGTDLATLSLKTVRRGLDIIPQEPVLFEDTVRYNVDPSGSASDSAIWTALSRVGLKTHIADLPDKLDHILADEGANLSLGQRQLLCLARSLISAPTVLVMDEATASVDSAAESVIYSTLKDDFKDTTVLAIAHRLNSLVDFDRILVLSDGEVVQFESTRACVERVDGPFMELLKGTGQENVRWFVEKVMAK